MYTHALMSAEQSRVYRELCSRGDYTPLPLQMNGCIFMPDDDLERLLMNHRSAGYDTYSQTFGGNQPLHDKLVGRKGEFEFLKRMAVIAARLGYTRQEQILLTERTLPTVSELISELDTWPGNRVRQIAPIVYIGRAKGLERERVTRKSLSGLPDAVKQYLRMDQYKSEAEWLAWIGNNYSDARTRKKYVMIRIDEANLEKLLTRPCGEIFNEYIERYMEVYRQIPEITELCAQYGNRDNEKLYWFSELERKWIEIWLEQNPLPCADGYAISGF
jgi:hypothetical protein